MKIRIIDTETTGIPSETVKHALVEVGWTDLDTETGEVSPSVSWLVNPGRAIPPEASAVHHITDEDVIGAPAPDFVMGLMMDGADVFAAHNVKFDQQFFAGGGRPWICTMTCAKHLWPDSPGFGNQTLRYWKRLAIGDDRAQPSHRAGPDTFVTALILRELLKVVSVEDLIALTSAPVLLQKMPFGKHAGMAFSEIPFDYLNWMVERSNIDDRDVMHTARAEMKKRRGGR